MSDDIKVSDFNKSQSLIVVNDDTGTKTNVVDSKDTAIAVKSFDSYKAGDRVAYENPTYVELRSRFYETTKMLSQGQIEKMAAEKGFKVGKIIRGLRQGIVIEVFKGQDSVGYITAKNNIQPGLTEFDIKVGLDRIESHLNKYGTCPDDPKLEVGEGVVDEFRRFGVMVTNKGLIKGNNNVMNWGNSDNLDDPNKTVKLSKINDTIIKIDIHECDNGYDVWYFNTITGKFFNAQDQ